MRSSSLPQHMATTFFVSAAWTTIYEHERNLVGPLTAPLLRASMILALCSEKTAVTTFQPSHVRGVARAIREQGGSSAARNQHHQL